MLIVMQVKATEEQINRVCESIREMGLTPHPIPGSLRVAIGITGNKSRIDEGRIISLSGVTEVIHVTQEYKLTSREMKPEDTVVKVGGTSFGDGKIAVIAGTCAVESLDITMEVAEEIKKMGSVMLRGGAYKPRTSPYSFQGLGEEGLKILAQARERTGLPIVTEAVDTDTFDVVAEYADLVQIGARNMQNYSLLKKAGRSAKPILLKRGISATIKEFLLAAEYIMSEGNYNVILCERGIRTFSDYSRYTLDISSIPELKMLTHLPVIIDPSHAAGRWGMVLPLARAAIAAGADGLIVEVHPHPSKALSDGAQSLKLDSFQQLMQEVKRVAYAIGREMGSLGN
ncbi:MAG: 3-deoxy-7-phosphoheptulonate synthase [Candidatus Wallbacteria bacterium]|nr:3-deoxy-7-phosphoheptulonate synthase [Candidatus Wallbacteria bacterium]